MKAKKLELIFLEFRQTVNALEMMHRSCFSVLIVIKAILLIRGSKPLKLSKITPEEHPSFEKLKPCKAIDYEPLWQKQEKEKPKSATGAQSHTKRFSTHKNKIRK